MTIEELQHLMYNLERLKEDLWDGSESTLPVVNAIEEVTVYLADEIMSVIEPLEDPIEY